MSMATGQRTTSPTGSSPCTATAVGEVTKDDIFYYVYGLLHDPAYRKRYAADLKKMLPHIPTPESAIASRPSPTLDGSSPTFT